MLVNFHCEKSDYDHFKNIVGNGNAGRTLRNFILSYGEKSDVSEKVLMKQYAQIDEEYKKLKAKHERIKNKVESIETKRKQDEISNLKKQEKELKKFQDIEYEQAKEDGRREALNDS